MYVPSFKLPDYNGDNLNDKQEQLQQSIFLKGYLFVDHLMSNNQLHEIFSSYRLDCYVNNLTIAVGQRRLVIQIVSINGSEDGNF